MQIRATCPGCHHVWRLDASATDRRIRCGQCGRLFKVPKPEELAKATQIIQHAKGAVYVDEDGKTYG